MLHFKCISTLSGVEMCGFNSQLFTHNSHFGYAQCASFLIQYFIIQHSHFYSIRSSALRHFDRLNELSAQRTTFLAQCASFLIQHSIFNIHDSTFLIQNS